MKTKSTLIAFILSALVMGTFVFFMYRAQDDSAAQDAKKEQVEKDKAKQKNTNTPRDLTPSSRQGDSSVAAINTLTPAVPKEARLLPHINMKELEKNDRSMVDAVIKALELKNPKALEELEKAGILDAAMRKVLENKELTEKKGLEDIGSHENGDKKRYRLNFKDGSTALLDLKKDAEGKWSLDTLKHQSAEEAARPEANLRGVDSLVSAENFMRAIIQANLKQARQLVDKKKISEVTLAGLCVIFEEGDYSLRTHEPIKNMFQTDTTAGYLVYLTGKDNNKLANIGLELVKEGDVWVISGVSMDSLLEAYTSKDAELDASYFPLVKNPKGGDSLALFFGFNEDRLTARSLRQLKIVAELLLEDTSKRLDITGHTDDVGSERYNTGLSARRANAVKAALVSNGVAVNRISTKAMGKSQPRRFYKAQESEADVEKARSQNRRTEIYLDFK